MSVETEVLRRLLKRENWLDWGALVSSSMFPTQEHTKLFNITREYHEKALGLPDHPDLGVKEIKTLLEASGIDKKSGDMAVYSELLSVLAKTPKDSTPGVTAALVQNFKRKSAVRQLGAHVFAAEEADGDAFDIKWAQIQAAAESVVQTDEEIETAWVEPVVLSELRTLEPEFSERVPIGFSPTIDEAMRGGLPIGQIGCVVAPTHTGKTMVLTNIGAQALVAGRNVAHVTLETDAATLAQLYYSQLKGIPSASILDRQSEVLGTYDKTWGKLRIYDMRSRHCGISTLERILRRLVSEEPVSLVTVDYLELLDRKGSERRDLQLGDEMRRLRKAGASNHFAVWTAGQATRYAKMDGRTKEHHVQGSIQIPQIADVAIYLWQDETEKKMGTLHCEVGKNRPGGKTFCIDLKVDYTTLKIREAAL